MSKQLEHSIFHQVLFPDISEEQSSGSQNLCLRRSLSFHLPPGQEVRNTPWVIFDFETTGLSPQVDRVIEIGALKYLDGEVIGEMSTLISVDIPIPDVVQNITGITPSMLVNQPKIADYMPKFLDFIEGSVLVAHNAEFDMSMLLAEANRLGIDIDWACFCTLKLARDVLADLPRKNLDSLAEHYELEFEARHRSIGDAKVTVAVLNNMLSDEARHLKTWKDFEPYRVEKK